MSSGGDLSHPGFDLLQLVRRQVPAQVPHPVSASLQDSAAVDRIHTRSNKVQSNLAILDADAQTANMIEALDLILAIRSYLPSVGLDGDAQGRLFLWDKLGRMRIETRPGMPW